MIWGETLLHTIYVRFWGWNIYLVILRMTRTYAIKVFGVFVGRFFFWFFEQTFQVLEQIRLIQQSKKLHSETPKSTLSKSWPLTAECAHFLVLTEVTKLTFQATLKDLRLNQLGKIQWARINLVELLAITIFLNDLMLGGIIL